MDSINHNKFISLTHDPGFNLLDIIYFEIYNPRLKIYEQISNSVSKSSIYDQLLIDIFNNSKVDFNNEKCVYFQFKLGRYILYNIPFDLNTLLTSVSLWPMETLHPVNGVIKPTTNEIDRYQYSLGWINPTIIYLTDDQHTLIHDVLVKMSNIIHQKDPSDGFDYTSD